MGLIDRGKSMGGRNSIEGPVYVTPEDLAERWKCTEKRVTGLRRRRSGPPFVKIGGAVRYDLADVEAYEARRRWAPEPPRRSDG